ncbi:hypothetical protein ACTWWB_004200 [Vibrio fluvialis]|uniref:hypothetical protein n=1 Tax=Vibrio fluvialis TaxID=676 RepID=UPI0020123F8A|nr:hypothetical protein [Vibrio fluvialis]
MFRISEVLEFEKERFRVLSLLGDELVWISIDDKSAFPVSVDTEVLYRGIEDETLHRVEDPYVYLTLEVPEEGSIAQVKRNKNYALIQPIIRCEEYYRPGLRAKAINAVMAEHKTTKQTLYRLIRQYWQRGQIVNALLPDYKNSGGKGNVVRPGRRNSDVPESICPAPALMSMSLPSVCFG